MEILRILFISFFILIIVLVFVKLFSFYLLWIAGKYTITGFVFRKLMNKRGMVEVVNFEEQQRLDPFFKPLTLRLLKRKIIFKNPSQRVYVVLEIYWKTRNDFFIGHRVYILKPKFGLDF